MANPQKENGYTAIANELLEAIMRSRLHGCERDVLDAIIRKTYGFQKKADRLPISQISRMTGITATRVCRLLKSLKLLQVITRDENGITALQKDYTQWLLPRKAVPYRGVPYRVVASPLQGHTASPLQGRLKRKGQKKLSKETLSKDKEALPRSVSNLILLKNESRTMSEQIDHSFPRKRLYGNEKINWLLDYSEHLMGKPLTGQERWNRIYAQHMANKYGMKRARELLEKALNPVSWWFDKVSQFSTLYKNFEKIESQEVKKLKQSTNTDITNL